MILSEKLCQLSGVSVLMSRSAISTTGRIERARMISSQSTFVPVQYGGKSRHVHHASYGRFHVEDSDRRGIKARLLPTARLELRGDILWEGGRAKSEQ